MCKVLNKHRHGVPAGAIYIGRGSKWGNPFRIGPDGDRAAVIAKHERWFADQHHLLRALDELCGRDLVCFCAPLAVAHGGGNLFFQLVNARYEKGAMILTSNRGFAEWGEVIGEPMMS